MRAVVGVVTTGGVVMTSDMLVLLTVCGSLGTARDPGREQVVGVFGQVIADEYVEKLGVAAKMAFRENDQLPLAGADGDAGRAVEVLGIASEHRRGYEDGRRARRLGLGDHLGGGPGVTTDEALQEGRLVDWHTTTVALFADDALTRR